MAEVRAWKAPNPKEPARSGPKVLSIFAALVAVYGVTATVWKWPWIAAHADEFLFVGGLCLLMVAGMFVQIVSRNFHQGRALFELNASELILPVLFAPIVFYPIWIVGKSHGHDAFSLYSAFMNGYFWESIVATTQRGRTPPMGSSRTAKTLHGMEDCPKPRADKTKRNVRKA
jgi:hypothetical protein